MDTRSPPPGKRKPFKAKAPAIERRIIDPKKFYEEASSLCVRMSSSFLGQIDFGSLEYSGGFSEVMGKSTAFNGPLTSRQFAVALHLSCHPEVKKLLHNKICGGFDPGPLRRAQVLSGMKILDLGCGFPIFARASRRLGADVYTVDVASADTFEYDERFFSAEDRTLEASRHIQLDLNGENAVETILRITGGDFDLVTEAYLEAGWFHEGRSVSCHSGKKIAMELLKKGGVHFNADAFGNNITLRE